MPPFFFHRGLGKSAPKTVVKNRGKGGEGPGGRREIAGTLLWIYIRWDLVARTAVLSGIDRPQSGRGFAG